MHAVRAPEFDPAFAWLNTDRALSFAGELRGRVVILDFWTYCCINCIHILPDLAALERKYEREPVVFIGVHSAKFSNEASPATIRAAIQRYEIQHPVIIDEGMKLWRAFAVRSWPTQVVIDSTGRVVLSLGGEGHREEIDAAIAQALAQGRTAGTLADGPLQIKRDASVRAAGGLKFPGKVLADAKSKRLFVADSNHNRIIIAELPDESGKAKVLHVVGSGAVGQDDGPADKATFDHPQGLALAAGKIYVADTENHLIRAVDVSTGEVTTVVGTGEMCNDRAGGGMGTQQGLNSPWDLTAEGSTLYVAMAGVHQLWRIDLPVGFARAFAGSGRENLVDGPTEQAALAQPSGICAAMGNLYFADSEVSAIRGVDMASEQVFTLVGEGLFTFGDVDGPAEQARLQHPLGVTAWGSTLLITDTYNHKVKSVDPGAGSVRTVLGTGKAGAQADDGRPAFFEPGGLSVADNQLFVADTNNHRIVRVDLATLSDSSCDWCEVVLEGLTPPGDESEAGGDVLGSDPVAIKADSDVELTVEVTLPTGAHLSGDAPWSVRVSDNGATLKQQTGKSDAWPLKLTIPANRLTNPATWRVEASFAYCTEGATGVCVPVQLRWDVPVSTDGAASAITLHGSVI